MPFIFSFPASLLTAKPPRILGSKAVCSGCLRKEGGNRFKVSVLHAQHNWGAQNSGETCRATEGRIATPTQSNIQHHQWVFLLSLCFPTCLSPLFRRPQVLVAASLPFMALALAFSVLSPEGLPHVSQTLCLVCRTVPNCSVTLSREDVHCRPPLSAGSGQETVSSPAATLTHNDSLSPRCCAFRRRCCNCAQLLVPDCLLRPVLIVSHPFETAQEANAIPRPADESCRRESACCNHLRQSF
jgi:hypothetical protein